MKFRRFRWMELPKRKRQAAYLGSTVVSFTFVLNYKFKECVEVVGNPAQIQNPNTIWWLRLAYGRMRSRWFGSLSELHVPVALRSSLYSTFAWRYGANIDEVRYPLDSFRSFQEFFCRALKDNVRPIQHVPNGMVSPVDAQVVNQGFFTESGARIEQVKGANYSVPAFLGFEPVDYLKEGSTLAYVVLYLAPGDYHRIHAPCDLQFKVGRHFAGELLPVRPSFVSRFSDIFSINERLVLTGSWKFGHMNMVAVAAANVGGIYLDWDERLKTNRLRDVVSHCGGDVSTKQFHDPVKLAPGAPVGGFRLGSTVVMVFEVPKDNFKWSVNVGDKIKVGETLGLVE